MSDAYKLQEPVITVVSTRLRRSVHRARQGFNRWNAALLILGVGLRIVVIIFRNAITTILKPTTAIKIQNFATSKHIQVLNLKFASSSLPTTSLPTPYRSITKTMNINILHIDNLLNHQLTSSSSNPSSPYISSTCFSLNIFCPIGTASSPTPLSTVAFQNLSCPAIMSNKRNLRKQ